MSEGSTVYVVGSGPAGVACASGLVGRGLQVVMLDGGLTLEPERQAALNSLNGRRPEEWDPAVIASFKERVVADAGGVQMKYIYGSDFPYQHIDRLLPRRARDVGHLTPSLAQGGFSNIWGAALLPYTAADIASWPVTPAELDPHYRAVLSFMGVSARTDGLAKEFPLHSERLGDLKPSRQAAELLTRMNRHRDALQARGLTFGSSRLAVNAAPCVYCGLCMYGCPYGLIYSSSQTLAHLKARPDFHYQDGVIVRRVEEFAGGARVHAEVLATGEARAFDGAALFLAAGVLPTTRILLESLEAWDRPLELKVSEYFLLPLLSYRKAADVQAEKIHTLAQVFVECLDRRVSERSVHMQVYTYSDLYEKALRRTLRLAGPLLRLIEPEILGRMLIIQGYLHSDVSSRISVRLLPDEKHTLVLEGATDPGAARTIKRVVSALTAARAQFGAVPLRPMLQIGRPGDGRHAGGTFPMSAAPGDFQSDRLGRPRGFSRVYAVDATVLPTIPAPPITFNVMANAHRIADAYAREVRR